MTEGEPWALAVRVIQIAELAVAGLLSIGGVLSLVSWMRRDYESGSVAGQLLYALHRTARVGLWFAFAGLSVEYALVDDPQDVRWYLFVPIGLAAVQFLTAMALSRMPDREGLLGGTPARVNPRTDGKAPPMSDDPEGQPGFLEGEKRGDTSEPGSAQPEAAEVESARLLANQAREELEPIGLDADEIRRLADEYIALDQGEDLEAFVDWARARSRT